MANTDWTRLLDGYSLLAIKDFIANNYLPLSGGTLTGNLIFKKNGNTIPNISFQGTKATYAMIKFLDNTGDTYGNGISIGGGGAVVIGAGESADAIVSGASVSGGTETLYLGSDGNIYLLTNVQNGYANAKTFTFADSGNLTVPGSITEAGTTLANKYAAKSHTHTKSQITDFPTSMPASDVYAWAKAATKPSYTYSEVGAAAAHHLYHTWDNNTNYYDSYEGGNMFRIITENMYADIFRFQASTVANLEYHNGSEWVAWSFDLSNLFDGNARTGVSIPYTNRKFRFTMRTNGGWPTTGMFMLQGTWFSDGGWPSGQKSDIIIETRANESASWTQRATFTLSGVEGMASHTLSSLHTGETYYRITITIYPWTNTSNSCPLQRLCLFSNYNGGALEKITHDGYGNVTIPTLKSTTIYENGTALSSKYLALSGGTMTGNLNIGDGTHRLMFRTNGSYANGIYYSTPGNEALVFATKYNVTSWIFATTDPTQQAAWTGLTPSLQIKNGRVTINKLIAGGTDAAYNLDVNGTLNATTIYQNGSTLADTYLGKTAKAADADKLDGHDSTYFINTDNIASQSVYHAENAGYASESHTLNGQEASYYLNYNNFTNKPSAVLYTSQSLTDAQKTQARTNIGAGTSSFTGYTSSNKLHTDYINNAAGWTSVTESTVSGWGFTKNAGTVTSVKVGSTSYSPSSGVVSLPAYPTKSSWNYDDTYIKLSGSSSITGNLVPNTDGAAAEGYNLGSLNKKWKYGYFYTLYSGGLEVNNGSNTYTIWSDGAIARGNVGGSPNVVLTLPNTTGTLALVGDNNHSHALSIASGGSSPTTLTANTTYTLTAGGSTLVFKTPPASSAYYSNQFNQVYYFSTTVAIALTNATNAGNMNMGFSDYPSTHDYYLQSGHNINTFSKYYIMNVAQSSDYVGSIIFGRSDNGYDNIIASRSDYAPTTGYTQENLDTLRIYASSMYINVRSGDSVLYSIPLGRKCHTITITGGTGTSTILFNLRNSNSGQITSIANVCAALYYNGHRNAASALIATGIYGSYTKPIIGIYATSSNSGLNVVYMNSTTKSTASITSGTVGDNTSYALYEA